MCSPDLDAVFRATRYRVMTDRGVFDLRIDTLNEAFDHFLTSIGIVRWAVVTACNPQAVRRDDADNALRQQRLGCRLDELGYACLAACNVADDGFWPDEPAFFVLQIDSADASVLAREFGQRAVVCGRIGSAPRLFWVGPAEKTLM